MVQPKSGRIEALEGVRGIAALIVAIFHFCSGFLPHIVPDRQPNASPSWLVDTPLEFFYNGPFAVTIFFVLSGFVIANAAANRPFPLILNLVFRYARLAVPVIVSVILAWALLTAFPDEAKKLSHVISSDWLSGTYQDPIPDFYTALREGLFNAFFAKGVRFNNVLWTMRIELIGSCGVYVFYALVHERFRILALPFCFIAIAGHDLLMNYENFVLGALIRELYVRKWYFGILSILLFLIGILLGFPGTGFSDRVHLPYTLNTFLQAHPLPGWLWPSNAFWDSWGLQPPFKLDMFVLGDKESMLCPLAASLIIYGVLGSSLLQRILSMRAPAFLGRISFALYLIHVPLIYTVFAKLYLILPAPVGAFGLAGIFAAFLFACLLGGYFFTVLVDEPALWLIAQSRRSTAGLLKYLP